MLAGGATLCALGSLGWLGGCGSGIAASAVDASGTQTPAPPLSVTAFYDVVIFGGTPSGLMAARAVAREGLRVALIEPTFHLGGVLTNGFSGTDTAFPEYIGGLTARFYADVAAFYGIRSGLLFESRVAEQVFNGYMIAARVDVLLATQLVRVQMGDAVLNSVVLSNGSVLAAARWIDASYEGDLMAASGVSYVIGREARQDFGESFAGFGTDAWETRIATRDAGKLIPGVEANPNERAGTGDHRIMAYTFRTCLTNLAANRIDFAMPAGYDAALYEGVSRSIAANGYTRLAQLAQIQTLIHGKFNLLRSIDPFSSDLIGANYAYPDGTADQRRSIWQYHYTYLAGWLYFLANDRSVPLSIRNELTKYGLPRDEFLDNGNWPWQMYVREARRMRGQYVMTEADVLTDLKKSDAVSIGQWYIDSHYCSLYESANGRVSVEGELDENNAKAQPYQVPYWALLPRADQASNLLVTCALSATHVAFSSLRVEPTYMMLGEAAGVAAALSLRQNVSPSALPVQTLQDKLLAYGAKLTA